MATDGSAVELRPQSQFESTNGSQPFQDGSIRSLEENNGFSLPPADGGKDAWLCLMSCFMLEALIWGKSTPSPRSPTPYPDYVLCRISGIIRNFSGVL
jgi:hypothetical protein